MKHHLFIIFTCLLWCSGLFSFGQKTGSTTEKLSLDQRWLFHLGDIPFPAIKGYGESYLAAKAGAARGVAAMAFDDTEWRVLNLPHDWAMESGVDSNANLVQGYRKRGIGWYRRRFKLDKPDQGKALELQFEGGNYPSAGGLSH